MNNFGEITNNSIKEVREAIIDSAAVETIEAAVETEEVIYYLVESEDLKGLDVDGDRIIVIEKGALKGLDVDGDYIFVDLLFN